MDTKEHEEFANSIDHTKQMVFKSSWSKFRETGLLLLMNQFLHIFGWAIVIECDRNTGTITNAYPARVKFRGFSEESVSRAYRKVAKFMRENAEELEKEANED